MLSKILTKLWGLFPKGANHLTLKDILASADNREILLGVKRTSFPSPEQMIEDVDRTIKYSVTEDYSVWAKEAWSHFLEYMDKLMNEDLSERQVDYYRGALQATIQLLRISYKARNLKEDSKRQVHGTDH